MNKSGDNIQDVGRQCTVISNSCKTGKNPKSLTMMSKVADWGEE